MSSHSADVRVMIVDAETTYADELTLILEKHGYDVRTVYGSETALIVADVFKPHALISEVVMPGMNGIDLANHFAERYPECKVLLVSDIKGVIEVLDGSFVHGGLAFLRKPLRPADVLDFLATCRPECARPGRK